jgi:hypothetical protein
MSLEAWYYIAGIVSAAIGLVGLMALIVYARDTRKLRQTAEDQLEGMARPCVLLMMDHVNRGSFDQNPLILRNLGSGVALNIRYRLESSEDSPWVEAPALPIDGRAVSGLYLKHLVTNLPVTCEFESLSGARYRSESYIGVHTTDLDLRHKFEKL